MTGAHDSNKSASGFLVSAPWRSSGKTLVSIGLARAAKRRGLAIQPFKKGPDYIDPLWLAAASGVGCYNLDPYIQQNDELLATFHDHTNEQSLALVEGTMGLHDGLQTDGSDSNAAIARALGLPVILVVDCRGMHRTVAALINGIQQFDPTIQFAGVMLNRIRSSRHEEKIRSAMETYCDTSVLGVIPETRQIHIDEKQLGLVPAPDFDHVAQCIDHIADLITQNSDLDSMFGNFSPSLSNKPVSPIVSLAAAPDQSQHNSRLKIGLARDEAFHFYYQDDLDNLRDRGVELIEVSPIHDDFPSDLDAFIIGGGFPERHARALADNKAFRQALLTHIDNGLVVHAECAGLMYLCRSLKLDDGDFDMVGAVAGDVSLHKKPLGRGYVQLHRRDEHQLIAAHEFHHSTIDFDSSQKYTYKVARGYGIDGENDGVQCNNAHASYAHFRHSRGSPWIDWFMQRIQHARCEAVATGTHH